MARIGLLVDGKGGNVRGCWIASTPRSGFMPWSLEVRASVGRSGEPPRRLVRASDLRSPIFEHKGAGEACRYIRLGSSPLGFVLRTLSLCPEECLQQLAAFRLEDSAGRELQVVVYARK